MKIRSFIALKLDDDIKKNIGKVIHDLKKTGADVKWVKAENLHLTLKFLGSIDTDQVQSISSRIDSVAGKTTVFEYFIADMGTFPDLKRPRVLWVGLRNHETLRALYGAIEDEMTQEGFENEKRAFRPHITIGRVRSFKGIDKLMPELVKYKSMVFGTQKPDSLYLMKSTLKPGGAEYEGIYRALLRRIS